MRVVAQSGTIKVLPTMMSPYTERYASLRKFMYIDQLLVMHDQLEYAGMSQEANEVGDFLHKLGKGWFSWLLPMGPEPHIAAWLVQRSQAERDERSRRLSKPWTEQDTKVYHQWLDAAEEAGREQEAQQDREFSNVPMQQVWVPCPHGTKMVKAIFPDEEGVYREQWVKIPRTQPAAMDRGENRTAERLSTGSTAVGVSHRPAEDYGGLVRQMHWGLRVAGGEFDDRLNRYDDVDKKAAARAAERERRGPHPFFLSTNLWEQHGGEDHTDGASSSQSMTVHPGGTVENRALPPHLQMVTRASVVRSDAAP